MTKAYNYSVAQSGHEIKAYSNPDGSETEYRLCDDLGNELCPPFVYLISARRAAIARDQLTDLFIDSILRECGDAATALDAVDVLRTRLDAPVAPVVPEIAPAPAVVPETPADLPPADLPPAEPVAPPAEPVVEPPVAVEPPPVEPVAPEVAPMPEAPAVVEVVEPVVEVAPAIEEAPAPVIEEAPVTPEPAPIEDTPPPIA